MSTPLLTRPLARRVPASATAQKLNTGLDQLMQRYDENGDGVLSLAEFSAMCARLNRDANEEQVQALFLEVQEASEKIEGTPSDALHPKAFAQIMQGTEGFVESDTFLDFLREMRLMPQEDE
jgi:hypothetical protein